MLLIIVLIKFNVVVWLLKQEVFVALVLKYASKFWKYFVAFIVFSMNARFPIPRLEEMQPQIITDSMKIFCVGTMFCFSSALLSHILA